MSARSSKTVFNRDRVYRYTLHRPLEGERGTCVFIGLNPSTADESRNDPTVTRCMGFARDWGFGELFVLNLFALRATDPKVMMAHPHPVGPKNNFWIKKVCECADLVVCAWGTKGGHLDRDLYVSELLLPLGGTYCLDITKAGHPKHPLYCRGSLTPVTYPLDTLAAPDNAGERLERYMGGAGPSGVNPGAREAADGAS